MIKPDAVSSTTLVTVIKHLPMGVLVETPDHRTGVIRIREVSWEPEERLHWQKLFPVGYQAQAVITKDKLEAGHYLEFSFRLSHHDPWANISERYQKGQIVDGFVTGIKSFGVFVEIAPGLTGLLHFSKLPIWVKSKVLDFFWPGDHVRVAIEMIDLPKRRIGLRLAAIDYKHPGKLPGSLTPTNEHSAPEHQTKFLPLEYLAQQNRKRILIIEDDLEQLGALKAWLQHVNQRVVATTSIKAGILELEKETPDIALVDLGLPGLNGIVGIQQIHARWPQIRCVLTTDWAKVDEHFDEIDSLQTIGVQLLLKPLLPEDVLDILVAEDGHQDLIGSTRDHFHLLSTNGQNQNLTESTVQNALQILLEQCRGILNFDAAIIFRMDIPRRYIEIVAKSGLADIERKTLDCLIHSPVRDVTEDKETILLEQLDPVIDLPRFRYLKTAVNFSACIGVPISSSLSQAYSLFCFDQQPHPISNDCLIYVQATALMAEAILEKKAIQDQAQLLQKKALLGQMTSGLVHEINHQLSPLNFSLDSLSNDLAAIQRNRSIDPGQAEREIASATEVLQRARESVSNLTNTIRMFGRLMTAGKNEEYVRLDQLIQQTIYLLRETARTNKVRIEYLSDPQLIILRSQVSQLAQVILNIVLNAIEQLAQFKPEQGGTVQIWLETATAGASTLPLIRILVQDNGPGIHWSLWSKIFEPGFTTRKDGSGFGLSISRTILEIIGGKIYVAESYILGGSIFAIELPRKI